MAADDDCHFAIAAVTSDFQGAHGAPPGAVGLCQHSNALPLLLALLGAGGMEAHVEDLIALSKEMDRHEILSEEEQHCPAPAGSPVVDRTHFPPPSAHCFPAPQSHSLLSRSMSTTSSEPQAEATSQLCRLHLAPCVALLFGQNKVKLSSRKEAKPVSLVPYQKKSPLPTALVLPKGVSSELGAV